MARETAVEIGGQPFTMMPLSLGAFRDLTREGHLAALNDPANVGQPDALIAVLSAALSRKHPECTRQWVATNVDMVDLWGLYELALKLSVPPSKEGASPNAESP